MGGGKNRKYELYREQVSDRWGFKITTCNGHTLITDVFEHTPAARAGVEIDDIIVTINQTPCENISHDQICQVIQKVDRHMTLVTRNQRKDEESMFGLLIREDAVRRLIYAGDHESMVRNTEEVARTSSESNHSPLTKGNGEIKERSSSKHGPKSMSGPYDSSVDGIRNNVRMKRTQYEQKKSQSLTNAKRRGDHSTSKVVANGSEGFNNTKTELPRKRSKHLYKSKSETDMAEVGKCQGSTVNQQEEEKVEDSKPSFPSMLDLQRSLPAGKRRTLLLNTNKSLGDRIASLNDL